MTRRLLTTGSPFEAEAGYARAVVQGPWVFVSGTTGYDYARMTMPEDVVDQARNALATIAAVLREAGADLTDLVRVQYFVTHMADAERLSPVFGEVLGHVRPAAGIYGVAALLRPEMRIEIEATAPRRDAGPSEAGGWARPDGP